MTLLNAVWAQIRNKTITLTVPTTTLAEEARRRLPQRRIGTTIDLEYVLPNGNKVAFSATFNRGDDGNIAEAFCQAFQEGSELRHLLHHNCIIASVALQHGATMASLAHAMGEDHPKAPGSFMGAIVRAGAALDREDREAHQ